MQGIRDMQKLDSEEIERAFERVSRQFGYPAVRPRSRPMRVEGRRPASSRPPRAARGYPGTGVRVSRVRGPHRRRPVTPVALVGLALLAALITLWLGVVAQFGQAVHGPSGPVPNELAVVQVQAGETLQHVAARVAPDAPVAAVVDRIRDLNKLDSTALAAGQTLISPIG